MEDRAVSYQDKLLCEQNPACSDLSLEPFRIILLRGFSIVHHRHQHQKNQTKVRADAFLHPL